MAGTVDLARAAFARRQWGDVCDLLASSAAPLEPEDLERLAVAAYLAGRVDASDRAWEHAHLAFARRGDQADAARCACWLAIGLTLRGEAAPASGWFARASRLIDGPAGECPARGYLMLPAFLARLGEGDGAAAADLSREMAAVAVRFDDADLLALATLCRGEALLSMGEAARGLGVPR